MTALWTFGYGKQKAKTSLNHFWVGAGFQTVVTMTTYGHQNGFLMKYAVPILNAGQPGEKFKRIKTSNEFDDIFVTLARTDLLCMLNWGTQWTMVS